MRTKHGTCLSLSPVAQAVLTRLATTWGISRSAVVEIVLRQAGAALDKTVADLETWVCAQTEARRGGTAAGMDGGQGVAEHPGEAKGQDTARPSGGPQRALRVGSTGASHVPDPVPRVPTLVPTAGATHASRRKDGTISLSPTGQWEGH